MKKRIFALIMVIVLLFAFQMPVFAASVQPRSEFYLVMTIIAYRGAGFEFTGSADFVKWLTYFLGFDGHTCLYFYNDGDESVQIGHWTLEPGEDMTIGTFGNIGVQDGIWYNVEAAAASSFGSSELAALTYTVSAGQMSTLNQVINRNDQYNEENDNCVNFAVEVWNSVVPDSLDLSVSWPATPQKAIAAMNGIGGHSNSFSMTQKSAQVVAYHTATGYTYYEINNE